MYEEKAENIASLVKEIKPDILCVQELGGEGAHSNHALTQLAQMFAEHYFEPANILGASGEELNLGNGIFSNFPMTAKKKVELWSGPNPTSNNKSEQRIYVEAVVNIEGRPLTVGTTHLSFAPNFADTPDRLAQLQKLMTAVGTQKSRFVITGDFNSTKDTKIIKELKSRFVSAGPDETEPSFSTIPFSFLGFDVKGLDWRVDYIFTTPDIKVLSSQIISTKFSDHLPILAEFEI